MTLRLVDKWREIPRPTTHGNGADAKYRNRNEHLHNVDERILDAGILLDIPNKQSSEQQQPSRLIRTHACARARARAYIRTRAHIRARDLRELSLHVNNARFLGFFLVCVSPSAGLPARSRPREFTVTTGDH